MGRQEKHGQPPATDHESDSVQVMKDQVAARVQEEAAGADPPGQNQTAAPPGKVTDQFVMDCLDANELGDGLLFSSIHRWKYIYDHTTREWYYWTGHHWALDVDHLATVAVEEVAERYLSAQGVIQNNISAAAGAGNSDAQKAQEKRLGKLFKRVDRLRSVVGTEKCLTFAHTSRDPLKVPAGAMDENPWLLGCANGVVDLRTGDFRPGRPDDYISKASPVAWDEDAKADLWEEKVLEIMDDDKETADFLRRMFGYSITGSVREQVLPVLYGEGRNGKGVITETISRVCGPLAGPIQAELLLDQGKNRSTAAPSSDIMTLKGLRMAFASETDENRKFSAARCKWLSGNDTLVGRYPYDKRETKFQPTHQLILLTNNKPAAPSADFAFWERLLLIPFPLRYVDVVDPNMKNHRPKDKDLYIKLLSELPGILVWLVRGCLEWQEYGLNPPDTVRVATKDYQRKEDSIAEFLDECTEDGTGEQFRVASATLYDAYESWYKQYQGNFPIKKRKFGEYIGKKYTRLKSGTIWYHGLRLITDLGR